MDGRGIKQMEQGMRIGDVLGTPIAVLNGGVWLDLIKKLTCDHRVEGGELVGLVESWGTSALARVSGWEQQRGSRGWGVKPAERSTRSGPGGPSDCSAEWLQPHGRRPRIP